MAKDQLNFGRQTEALTITGDAGNDIIMKVVRALIQSMRVTERTPLRVVKQGNDYYYGWYQGNDIITVGAGSDTFNVLESRF